jgi:dTMP kinase
MKRGVFIVVDGLGGTGKTTQLRMLQKRLGVSALFTSEPGGAPRAEKIRDVLKSGGGPKSDPLTDFFLFWAARAEHVNKKIAPALKRGKTVVCDRFDSSTYAMQVVGEGRTDFKKLFWQCREHVLQEAQPDAYVILDAPLATLMERRRGRKKGEDRFDERPASYQRRVGAGYREFVRALGKRAHIVDASGTKEETFENMWRVVKRVVRA